jgi:hypothetical protein
MSFSLTTTHGAAADVATMPLATAQNAGGLSVVAVRFSRLLPRDAELSAEIGAGLGEIAPGARLETSASKCGYRSAREPRPHANARAFVDQAADKEVRRLTTA